MYLHINVFMHVCIRQKYMFVCVCCEIFPLLKSGKWLTQNLRITHERLRLALNMYLYWNVINLKATYYHKRTI